MSGRGKAQKTIELQRACYLILQEIHPASVRAVCYKLFTKGLIPSMEKVNTNRISRILVDAREEGLIPWNWVVDETREAERINSFRDLADFGDAVKRAYRKDYWATQDAWVEVWSEKGTIRGTLAPVLSDYGITFRVIHGYSSATMVYDVAEASRTSAKYLSVLYVGDWDPSGMHMSEVDLPERIERYDGEIEITRIAIAPEDTLPAAGVPHFTAADKTKDPRHRWFTERYGQRCFELDALDPRTLRQRVEVAILEHLDVDAWNHAIEVEAAERESMRKVMEQWPSSISVPASKYSGEANA